jgi:arylsulfatase
MRERATYVLARQRHGLEESAVNTRNRDHVVTAHVDGNGEGCSSQGSLLGGWTFFKRGSTLSYVHNFARWRSTASTPTSRSPGPHSLQFRYASTSARRRRRAARGRRRRRRAAFKRVTPIRFSLTGAGLWCGAAATSRCDDYTGPFPWSGELHRVVVEVAGPPEVDAAAAAEAALDAQ